jgi:hypothetical protein
VRILDLGGFDEGVSSQFLNSPLGAKFDPILG